MSEQAIYLKRMNAALALREIPDYPAALEQLKKSVELAPEDANVHLLLGLTYQDLERLDEAEKSFRKSLLINPDSREATQALGLLLSKTGRNQEAIEILQPLHRSEPDNILVIQAIASALINDGKNTEAIDILLPAHQRAPENEELAIQLAQTLKSAHDTDQAIEILKKTISLHPTANLYHMLGSIYPDEGYERETHEAYERSVELDPHVAEVWVHLSYSWLNQGNLEKAMEVCDKGIKANPESIYLILTKADIFQQQGKNEECLQTYQQAITMARENNDLNALVVSMYLRDRSLNEIAGYQAALKQIEMDLKETDQNPILINLKIELMDKRGDYKKIIKVLENFDYVIQDSDGIIQYGPIHYKALLSLNEQERAFELLNDLQSRLESDEKDRFIYIINEIGIEIYQKGEIEKARACFNQVLAVHPMDDRAQIYLAFLSIGERKWDQALKVLEKFKNLPYFGEAVILEYQAYIDINQGKYEAAKKALQKAIKKTDMDYFEYCHVAYPWQGAIFQSQEDDYPARTILVCCAIYANLATAHALTGNMPEAWKAANEVNKLDPEESIGYRIKGCLHLMQGEVEQAKKMWRKALRSTRSKKEAKILKGWIKSLSIEDN